MLQTEKYILFIVFSLQFKAFFSTLRGYSPKMMLRILTPTLLEHFSYNKNWVHFIKVVLFLHFTKTCCIVSEFSLQNVQLSDFLRQYFTCRILLRILYCSQLTEESLVVLQQTLKTSYTQRSSTKHWIVLYAICYLLWYTIIWR